MHATAATPPRKFKVFVSSVSTEFDSLRQKMWESIYKAGHIPVVIEKSSSAPPDVLERIKEEVQSSDIFVFILGEEYGRAADAENHSFTDFEINLAIQNKEISIILLRSEPPKNTQIRPASPEEEEIETRYRKMSEKVKKSAIRVISFHHEEQNKIEYAGLCENFTHTLHELTGTKQKGGWIPASWFDDVSEQIKLGTVVSQNPFFERLVKRLDSFLVLSRRTVTDRGQKELMSAFFWEAFLARLAVHDIKELFFESGSTIAYLSYDFIQRTKHPWVRKWIAKKDLVIKTNNILTYLDFILTDPFADPVECHLRPPAPADTYYGATFGRLTSLVKMWPPRRLRPLSDKAAKAVNRINDQLALGKNSLVLMTASGLDNSNSEFKGPHVGSYYNMLIKRALLTNELPTVLVLEESKVFKKYSKGRCFAVCDRTGPLSWEEICRKKPLAILTCVKPEKAEKTCKKLGKLGFNTQLAAPGKSAKESSSDQSGTRVRCILAANKLFAERFDLSDK